MKNKMVFALAVGLGAVAYGSVITPGSLTELTGTPWTISAVGFAVDGDQMAGMTITATFSGGSSASCTWATGTTNAGCTSANNFSLLFPHLTDTDPDTSGSAGIWTLTDLRAAGVDGNNIVSLTVDAIVGGVSFDRCLKSGGFDDTNNGITVCNTGSGGLEGTPGTAEGWSVNNADGGTSGITATPTYFDVLHLSGQAPVLDAWGELKLQFTGSTFAPTDTFTFRADTDLVSATADVPEPATLGLLGLGLLGLGALRSRRKV